MSISHKLNLALSMEDDAPNVQVNIDTDEGGMPLDDVVATDDGDFEPTPEADAAEITERAEEIDEENGDIEDMEVATESLIATYEAMALAQRNGGLTREAATFAAISVESVMSKYNVTHEDLGISLESFDENKSRATTISMESIASALKDLWDAIVRKFKEMVKKIVDFYQKTIAAAPRIKRRAEGLKKKAQKTTGSPKESKIKTGLFGQLNVQGAVPTAKQIEQSLDNVRIAYVDNIGKETFTKSLEDLFKVESYSNDTVRTTVFNVLGKTKLQGATTPPAGFKFKSGSYIGSLIGNRAIFRGFSDRQGASGNAEQTISAVANFQYGVFEDKAGVKNDKDARDKEFPVLSTSDVETICSKVIMNMDEIIRYKTQAVSSANYGNIVEKEGKKLVEKMGKDENGKASEAEAGRYLSALGSIHRKAQSGNAAIVRYNYTASKAALAYCARSLSQYKD